MIRQTCCYSFQLLWLCSSCTCSSTCVEPSILHVIVIAHTLWPYEKTNTENQFWVEFYQFEKINRHKISHYSVGHPIIPLFTGSISSFHTIKNEHKKLQPLYRNTYKGRQEGREGGREGGRELDRESPYSYHPFFACFHRS